MEEQLISFETAKLAKEKGFKLGSGWQIRSLFNIKDGETFCEKTIETPEYACERCTQSLLQKWLREVHNCHVEVIFHSPLDDSYITKDNLRYCFEVNYYGKNFNIPFTDDEDYSGYDYLTYEEALEKGLQEALKLI